MKEKGIAFAASHAEKNSSKLPKNTSRRVPSSHIAASGFLWRRLMMKKVLLGLLVGSFPGIAFADCINMMDGEPGMMMSWGNHMGGRLFMGLFGLLYLAGVVLFFCLLFRITRALETIAKAKKVE